MVRIHLEKQYCMQKNNFKINEDMSIEFNRLPHKILENPAES